MPAQDSADFASQRLDYSRGFVTGGMSLKAFLRSSNSGPLMSPMGHFRPIRPGLPAGSCLLRPESGPDAGATSRKRRLAQGPEERQGLAGRRFGFMARFLRI